MIVNKSKSRKYALEYAARARAHKFTRVDASFYIYLDNKLKEYIRCVIMSLPSKGKTISF